MLIRFIVSILHIKGCLLYSKLKLMEKKKGERKKKVTGTTRVSNKIRMF